MGSITPLFETLQKEFCPPLDSALVAALLNDYDTTERSDLHLLDLKAMLRDLAAQATIDESQLMADGKGGEVDDEDEADCGETNSGGTTGSSDDKGETTSGMTTSSDTSISPSDAQSQFSNDYSFTSPIGFLQTVLPGVPIKTIKDALNDAAIDGSQDVGQHLWDVITGILSTEYIREMEERGLQGLEEEDAGPSMINPDEWKVAGKKNKPGSKKSGQTHPKRTKPAVTKIVALGHVRQQQSPQRQASGFAAFDPWTQISSICTHLSTLIPAHPPSFFQSYFHSPSYNTPYKALCAALSAVNAEQKAVDVEYAPLLQSLLEVILPSYPHLDTEQSALLVDDTRRSLHATSGVADRALDLVRLLRELDNDWGHGNGDRELGVYHQPSTSSAVISGPHIPLSPPPPLPPPPITSSRSQPPSPVVTKTKPKPDPSDWQSVPERKIPQPHRLSQSIPAYNRHITTENRNGKAHKAVKLKGSGNAAGKGGKGDVGELSVLSTPKRNRYLQQRDEMLRQAAKMWQKGNTRTRGGEVALYYAEKAREFQEMARKEALNAARDAVEAKRLSTLKQDTIDLHGTTIGEALAIVKETLVWYGCSPANPLWIITGRGIHSANQVGVLKPAIRKELQNEGWDVRAWDGGLVVHGKR